MQVSTGDSTGTDYDAVASKTVTVTFVDIDVAAEAEPEAEPVCFLDPETAVARVINDDPVPLVWLTAVDRLATLGNPKGAAFRGLRWRNYGGTVVVPAPNQLGYQHDELRLTGSHLVLWKRPYDGAVRITPAKRVPDATVLQTRSWQVAHVVLDRHALINVNGAWTESAELSRKSAGARASGGCTQSNNITHRAMGRDVRALAIFKEPSKAPAGMFAEACADAERLDDPAFAPFAAAALQNVGALGDLAVGVPDAGRDDVGGAVGGVPDH